MAMTGFSQKTTPNCSRRQFLQNGVLAAAAASAGGAHGQVQGPLKKLAESKNKQKKPLKIFYTWDLSDPPRYHAEPIGPDYFDWLFSRLAGTGITFLFRCNLSGRTYYPSTLMSPIDRSVIDPDNPKALQMWQRVVQVLEDCDPLAEAVRAARKYKVPIWAWWNWQEFQNVRRGWISMIDPTWYQNPRKYWSTRDGSRFYHGVPDWGDAEVRARLVGLAKESLAYDVDGIYVSSRSHSWHTCWPAPGWMDGVEPFGFNDSVVAAYKKAYGTDIRYEKYDAEAWDRVKGELYSEFLAQVGSVVHEQKKPLVLGIRPDRYNLMVLEEKRLQRVMDSIRLYKDWEKWVADGTIDGLCAEQTCPHTPKIPGADISPMQQTLPKNFPLYSWADTATWVGGVKVPFSLRNWNRHSVADVLTQIRTAQAAGAAGVVLHSLYHFTAVDSAGEYIGQPPAGYGPLPRDEYFDALRAEKFFVAS
jgi:hypothetical protein